MIAAIVLLRVMPQGISGRWQGVPTKGACIALIARCGAALLLVVLAALGPFLLSQFNLLQLSSFAAMGLATLGLALAWGYVGILSFGHAAFFGLGAYAYAIAAINFGDSTLAIFLAILVLAAFSLLLGHFLFFGRVGDVYLAVITLCVTLILFSFTNSTAVSMVSHRRSYPRRL